MTDPETVRIARRAMGVNAGLLLAVCTLGGCNMRQDQAGPNSSETKAELANMREPVDKTPLSSTPGAAPDNSHVEPRDPATR